MIACLPRTAAWLAAATSHVHRLDAELPAFVTARRITSPPLEVVLDGSSEGATNGCGGARTGGICAAAVPSMQTGRAVLTSRVGGEAEETACAAAAWAPVAVCTPEGIVRVAIASLVAEQSAFSVDCLPETLEYDTKRHMHLQNEFQRLRVLAACLLLAQSSQV